MNHGQVDDLGKSRRFTGNSHHFFKEIFDLVGFFSLETNNNPNNSYIITFQQFSLLICYNNHD